MEADAILKMVEYAFRHHFFIIDVIVSNDESTIQAVLKNPSIGAWGQFMKSSNVKLDEKTPVPSLLANPSHSVKVISKHIFYIVNDGESQRCGCTKSYAFRIKKYWGYTIRNNKRKN